MVPHCEEREEEEELTRRIYSVSCVRQQAIRFSIHKTEQEENEEKRCLYARMGSEEIIELAHMGFVERRERERENQRDRTNFIYSFVEKKLRRKKEEKKTRDFFRNFSRVIFSLSSFLPTCLFAIGSFLIVVVVVVVVFSFFPSRTSAGSSNGDTLMLHVMLSNKREAERWTN